MREGGKKVLSNIPAALEIARRTEEHVKGMVAPGTLFEELGFNYIGPIDGHDLSILVPTIRNMMELPGPQFLHIVTQKGKGYSPAEAEPIAYHAINKIEPKAKVSLASPKPKKPSYSNIFGEWICDMAAQDQRLVGITPAMEEGSDLIRFAREYPDRYHDVAIAEQHAVTMAAGLACDGAKPVVAIYSTFLQRAYDQLIHDVAIQNLDVLFAIDRAGLVGQDGPTHAGSFDLSYLRCVPNMVVMAPADENETRQMLFTGYQHIGPSAVRYPRGCGPGVTVEKEMTVIPLATGEIRRHGADIAILAFGSMLTPSIAAAEQLDATVANMRFVKPIDEKLILDLASRHNMIVTVEENVVMGGAGSAVNEVLAANQVSTSILNLGLPDLFIEHAYPDQMLQEYGLDAQGIVKSINSRLQRLNLPASKYTLN
jgi:1-deoxy-D-xylulose-5-phosphate synthase